MSLTSRHCFELNKVVARVYVETKEKCHIKNDGSHLYCMQNQNAIVIKIQIVANCR